MTDTKSLEGKTITAADLKALATALANAKPVIESAASLARAAAAIMGKGK